MVENRVAVADAASAHGLLRRLTGLFDRSDRSYTMVGPPSLEAPSGGAA
jgi:hypothetical protein